MSFRQMDEKQCHLLVEADIMVWCPKMDLIAVSNVIGEVVLHRLSQWQKVWTLPPLSETTKVSSLAWRPDGKVLAIGYTNGKIRLCDVENSSCLHDFQVASCVTFLGWISETERGTSSKDSATDAKELFPDHSSKYLPKLPALSKSYDPKSQSEKPAEDSKKLKDQKELNILMIGMECGKVELSAFGVFFLGVLDLSKFGISEVGRVLSVHLSDDCGFLSVVVEETVAVSSPAKLHVLGFDSSLLARYSCELRTLALKFGQLLALESYLQSTLNQMAEAWEDILLEMDSKLSKFAEEKFRISGGSVSNDFLRLLMFGIPSDELKNFLIFDLTEKGLKKLGHSIESSYSNIQKLLLKHCHSVGQAILFHLSDVKGMSLWTDKFGPLGLSSEKTKEAISQTGSLLLKASELQQVIDGSMKNFKAFFRWLYVVIQRLSDEPVPHSLSKMSQQELSFVAQFLKDNFTHEVEPSKSGFKLEKVGQYLKKETLTNPLDNSGNPWQQFLADSSKAKDSPLLHSTYNGTSLTEMHRMLRLTIDELLQNCATTIGQSFQFLSSVGLIHESVEAQYVTHISQVNIRTTDKSKAYVYSGFLLKKTKCTEFFICRQSIESSSNMEIVAVEPSMISLPEERTSRQKIDDLSRCIVLDLSFYDNKTLSLLIQEDCDNGRPVVLQVPLNGMDRLFELRPSRHRGLPDIKLNKITCKDFNHRISVDGFRILENMKASKFAVSGTRKVACVLFSSRRRVRLFLLDVEDEDDETTRMDCTKDESQIVVDDASTSHVNADTEDEENKENSSA